MTRDAVRTSLPVASGTIAVVLFIIAETMFFAGLASGAAILRAGQAVWPPPDQPRLPAAVTLANLALLLATGAALWTTRLSRKGLVAATAGGAVFLAVQGTEWVRILASGPSQSNLFLHVWHALVGAHGLHVLGGLVFLILSLWKRTDPVPVSLYWTFVVLVWPILYFIVY